MARAYTAMAPATARLLTVPNSSGDIGKAPRGGGRGGYEPGQGDLEAVEITFRQVSAGEAASGNLKEVGGRAEAGAQPEPVPAAGDDQGHREPEEQQTCGDQGELLPGIAGHLAALFERAAA